MADITKRLNTTLTEKGKGFIKTICSGQGRTKLSGKFALSFCDPESSVIQWNSNAMFSNGNKPQSILTDDSLGDCIIFWYNKYAKIFELDGNILAAQGFHESSYNLLAFNNASSASGINQFTNLTLYSIVVQNSYHATSREPFTLNEISKITENVSPNNKNSYDIYTTEGLANRSIIFQNVIDNPEIMIKAQYTLMAHLSSIGNDFVSTAVSGYVQGQSVVRKTYVDTLSNIKSNPKLSSDAYAGTVNYNYALFDALEKHFGYNLGINNPSKDFPPFNANSVDNHNSNVNYKQKRP